MQPVQKTDSFTVAGLHAALVTTSVMNSMKKL